MLIQKQFNKQNSLRNLKKLDNNGNATDPSADQNMFVLTILEKINKSMTKIHPRERYGLIKDCELRRSKS